jgi:hypothetical protein
MQGSHPLTTRIAALFRAVARDVRSGQLLSEQPHNVDMCTCCDGDPRLRRCDELWKHRS